MDNVRRTTNLFEIGCCSLFKRGCQIMLHHLIRGKGFGKLKYMHIRNQLKVLWAILSYQLDQLHGFIENTRRLRAPTCGRFIALHS